MVGRIPPALPQISGMVRAQRTLGMLPHMRRFAEGGDADGKTRGGDSEGGPGGGGPGDDSSSGRLGGLGYGGNNPEMGGSLARQSQAGAIDAAYGGGLEGSALRGIQGMFGVRSGVTQNQDTGEFGLTHSINPAQAAGTVAGMITGLPGLGLLGSAIGPRVAMGDFTPGSQAGYSYSGNGYTGGDGRSGGEGGMPMTAIPGQGQQSPQATQPMAQATPQTPPRPPYPTMNQLPAGFDPTQYGFGPEQMFFTQGSTAPPSLAQSIQPSGTGGLDIGTLQALIQASGGSIPQTATPQTFARGGMAMIGAYRRRYDDGGMADAEPVGGQGGGQDDNVPADLPHGSFVIPADVTSAVGDGNTSEGQRKLMSQLPAPKKGMARMRSPGAVPALVSPGETVIPPDQVAATGAGSLARGDHKLHKMIKNVRRHKASKGGELPPKAKSVRSYLK